MAGVRHLGVCECCGKLRYSDRREAKRAARLMHPEEHLRAYRCGDYWHVGHPKIRTGLP